MPELPEVEVTRRGVAPHVEGLVVSDVILRHDGLRWPFPAGLAQLLIGRKLIATGRRGKYLLLNFEHGCLVLHLGMSGSLCVISTGEPARKHDHFELVLGQVALRLNDPRRFGAVLWHDATDGHVENHLLLRGLGVEPFGDSFTPELLYKSTRTRSAPIKQVLLSGDIVVGVGNI
jgi:formamidopyrimidine-DNA glycosylase